MFFKRISAISLAAVLALTGCGAAETSSTSSETSTESEITNTAEEVLESSESVEYPYETDEEYEGNEMSLTDALTIMNTVEKSDKKVKLGETDLADFFGLDDEEAVLADDDLSYAKEILADFGYEDTNGNGVYKTKYPYSRIMVDGEVSDENAVCYATENGVTYLQYESPEEAAVSASNFEDDGYLVTADDDVEVSFDEYNISTTSTSYENSYMQLTCNADKGTEDVIVAVIDTGCATEYFDDDRIADTYNAADDTSDVSDSNGHGTTTCSTVIRNTGDTVSVLPIKIMDGNGSVYLSTIIRALTYALDAGADVVNMSVGMEDDDLTLADYLGDYIDDLIDNDCTVCVSAGNEATSTEYWFPANYEDCWTISSIGKTYTYSYFTCYEGIDFCAPGESITVTTYKGKTTTASGTSYSSPLMAAYVAQVASLGYGTEEERYEYAVKHCTDLGDEGYDDYYGYGLPVMPHNYDEETTEATCGTDGKITYTCDCGDTYSETIEATGSHDYTSEVTTEATCGTDGVITYTCSVCGDTYTETIDATGEHDYVGEITKEATCADGEITYTCSVCGDTYTETIDATGEHDYVGEITKEATCADGEITYTCSVCGDTYTETIDATDEHDYVGEITKEATCTAGEITYTCSVCGDTYTETIDATGEHEYTSKVTTKATCGTAGVRTYTCSVCGDTYTETIAATGLHTYTSKITKAATCTSSGTRTYTCSVCGDTYTKKIAATGHTESSTPVVTTTSTQKIYKYYCTSCGKLLRTVKKNISSSSSSGLTGKTPSQVSETLKKMTSDSDLAGSSYSKLKLRATKLKKKSITLKWKKVSGATKYVVYANQCGKSKKLKQVYSTTGNNYKATKVLGKKVKASKYYKFLVVAYDSDGKAVSTSKIVHTATKGKFTNAKSVKIKRSGKTISSLTISKGTTAKIKGTVVKKNAKKKIRTHRNVKYESSNKKIATVSASGKITAKKAGTCYIYAYAQNGVSKRIKVTVK